MDHSESDVGEIAHFPIRAMDYDSENMILYTGDEMGYMIKWDIRALVEKLNDITPKESYDPNLTDKQIQAL